MGERLRRWKTRSAAGAFDGYDAVGLVETPPHARSGRIRREGPLDWARVARLRDKPASGPSQVQSFLHRADGVSAPARILS